MIVKKQMFKLEIHCSYEELSLIMNTIIVLLSIAGLDCNFFTDFLLKKE